MLLILNKSTHYKTIKEVVLVGIGSYNQIIDFKSSQDVLNHNNFKSKNLDYDDIEQKLSYPAYRLYASGLKIRRESASPTRAGTRHIFFTRVLQDSR